MSCTTFLHWGEHDLAECPLKQMFLGTRCRSMAGEIGGGEVAVSGAAQGLHRCRCLRKQQLTEGWAEKRESKASQKSKGTMLAYYDQVQSWPISPSTRNHKVLFFFSVLPVFLPGTDGSSVSPSLFPNQPSLFTASSSCYQMHRLSQDKWPSPPQGHSLKPTTLAWYLHAEEFGLESVEHEQAVESIHNYLIVDWGFCSQPLDNLEEKKEEEVDVSKCELKVVSPGARTGCLSEDHAGRPAVCL